MTFLITEKARGDRGAFSFVLEVVIFRTMKMVIDTIIFRRMTHADFFNINKVGGEEEGGGGQSYIDFPVAKVSVDDWTNFLGERVGTGAAGPQWDVKVGSFGLGSMNTVRIYQRRAASVCITAQKLHSRESNRIASWHPNNGFPTDYNPDDSHLVIYLVKTDDGQIWAGWFLQNAIPPGWQVPAELRPLFLEPSAGIITPRRTIMVETGVRDWPFYLPSNSVIDVEIDEHLDAEDTSALFAELSSSKLPRESIERIVKIRARSARIVRELKRLYSGRCQISGDKYTFRKKDGELYSEVHHLIPLGDQGSDSLPNTVVVSPLIHKMLHYADVRGLDLTNIKDNKLTITINGEEMTITWHPNHAKTVAASLKE